jgi:protein O-mannosyl-transferase
MKIQAKKNNVFSSSLFCCFLLVICTAIIYFPGLHHGFFCWDDKAVALAPEFRKLTVAGIFHSFFSFHVGLYHPLTSISFMVDYFFGNGSPFPFHATNLILHICNTLLLFAFLKRLTGNLRISFIASLLFAVHPVHVESVAWITSRKDLLFSFFFLLSLLFYIDYTGKKQKVLHYLLVLLFFILALLSKIPAVSLPFVFLLIDYFRGTKRNSRMIVEKIPFFLLCIFFGWLNVLAQKQCGLTSYGYHFTFPEKTFLAIYSISQYFLKILFPYPLSVFYPFPFKPGAAIPLVLFSVPFLFITGVVLFFVLRRQDKRPVIFGLLFFLINIIIVTAISFNRDFIIADRYSYISSVGILFIAGVLADDLITNFSRYRITAKGLVLSCTVVLSLMTYQRNRLWKNPELLFRQALSVYQDSDIILNTLATQEIGSGKFREAIVHLDKAILVSPDYSDAFYNRGLVNGKIGNFSGSISDLSSAIRINPAYYEAYFSRGNAHMKMNDLTPAYDDFSMVIRLKPDHFGAFQNRAIVRGNLGDYAGAIGDLNTAISINPDFPASYYLRGVALFNTGGNGCGDLNKSLSMGYKEALRAIGYYCR